MRHRWLPPLAAATTAFIVFLLPMGYPWQLALLAATAIGAFVYSVQSTWARMRRLHRQSGKHRNG